MPTAPRHAAASALAALVAALTATPPRTTVAQPAAPPLRVLRVSPTDSASAGAVVTLVFDRPLRARAARGGPAPTATLDRGDGAPVAVRSTWVDPLTFRLVPLTPLAAGARYVITLANGLTGVDGERLAGPRRFSFLVRPPRLTASDPSLSARNTVDLPPDGRLRLLYDAPLDSAALARGARLTVAGAADTAGARCATRAVIAYTVVAQRPVRGDDPYPFQPRRAYPGNPTRSDTLAPDRFRRVVELRPTAPPPEGCRAILALDLDPSTRTADGPVPPRYPVRTAPPFELLTVRHDEDADSTLDIAFSAPVRPADLLAHLHLDPARPFTLAQAWGRAPQVFTLRTAVRPRTALRVVADSALRDTTGRTIAPDARTLTLVVPARRPRVTYDVGLVTTSLARDGVGLPVIRVRHVNTTRAELVAWPIPDSLRPRLLGLPTTTAATLAALGVTDSARVEVELAAPRDTERVTPVPLPPAVARRRDVALWAVRVRLLDPATGAYPEADTARTPQLRSAYVMFLRNLTQPAPRDQPLALVQGGDLAAHVRGAARDGLVAFVTRRSDGQPVPGARVSLVDTTGAARMTGTTDAAGLVTLLAAPTPSGAAAPPPAPRQPRRSYQPPAAALVEVSVGGARLVQPIAGTTGWSWGDAALSSPRLGGTPGPGVRARGILYPDRDYYRPGEWVHFTALAREGLLGALRPPPPGDSAHLTVVRNAPSFGGGQDVVRDTVLRFDTFGTLVDSLRIAPAAPLDDYGATLALWRDGRWQPIARTGYHVAEYRAPEFLVDVGLDSTVRLLGDTVRATVDARLLFDAPMPGATLRWQSTLTPAADVTLPGIPNTWSVGGRDWSSFGAYDRTAGVRVEHHDSTLTLAGRGPARIAIPTTRGLFTRPATLRVDAAVTDLNRQTVTHSASVTVHAARLYLAAHDSADAWTWRAGIPRAVRVLALRPDGRVVGNVRVHVAVVAARWVRDTTGQGPGDWVTDTLSRDSILTPTPRSAPALGDTALATTLHIVPPRAGAVAVVLRAVDAEGRPATTMLAGWSVGAGDDVAWWQHDTPVRLPLFATRPHLAPGDTADVQFTSPFSDATAWITVERERVLRSWSIPAPRGPHVLHIPITATDAPNVYVGVTLVPRGPAALGASVMRAAATPLDGRLRAGYALLEITPTAQHLALTITPQQRTYAPGDTARLRVRVADARGHGVPAAVTLWAVDAGVRALGDDRRPDPVATLYAREGLGWALGSTLTHLGTAMPPWLAWSRTQALSGTIAGGRVQLRGMSVRSDRRMRRTDSSADPLNDVVVDRPLPAPPPLGGRGNAPRSDFRSTAFFLGGIRTGADGRAEASAKLPDNLTTFRIVALAASAGDAYAGADTSLVTTRPLTVRAALPQHCSDKRSDHIVGSSPRRVLWQAEPQHQEPASA